MKKGIILIFSCLLALNVSAKIKLPAVLGDNMVLQQQSTVNLWGWATPSKSVIITPSWSGKKYTTQVDKSGKWLVKVETPTASNNAYNIEISDGETLKLKDILIGEVWICSGQSNMEMPLHGFYGQPVNGSSEATFEAAKYPNIRMFTVSPAPRKEPQEDCGGSWLQSTPKNVRDFSAVAYFYGRNLNTILNIPIGLINASCGGTGIESWMSMDAIKGTEGIEQALAIKPINDWESTVPTHLYNGMIVPIIRYTSKGFIWYQGESNQHNYFDYDKLMASLVKLWRKEWGNENMPFYYVQLAAFTFDGVDKISLPLTIEAQYKALKLIPNSGIIATTDVGHATAIHPPYKKEVGDRLAALALNHTYGVEVIPDAPVIDNVTFDGEKAILSFKNIVEYTPWAAGSISHFIGEIKGFEISGEDRKFHPAKAQHIENKNRIEVSCEQVPHPVAVRYAFRNVPDANVTTTEGQPLAPFRTDNWNDVY